MSMSTSVIGVRDLDGRFSQMITIKEHCDVAQIGYPEELVAYFGEHDAAETSEYLREMMETIDISDAMVDNKSGTLSAREVMEGTVDYQVDLSKLSSEVKAIRFTNSW